MISSGCCDYGKPLHSRGLRVGTSIARVLTRDKCWLKTKNVSAKSTLNENKLVNSVDMFKWKVWQFSSSNLQLWGISCAALQMHNMINIYQLYRKATFNIVPWFWCRLLNGGFLCGRHALTARNIVHAPPYPSSLLCCLVHRPPRKVIHPTLLVSLEGGPFRGL